MQPSWRMFWGWAVVAAMSASLVYLVCTMPLHRGLGLFWDIAAAGVCLLLGCVGLYLAMHPAP